MKGLFSTIGLVTALVLVSASCRKSANFPDEPILRWEGYELLPSESKIKFDLFFTDGNGDVGILDEDAEFDDCDIDSYNLRIFYFEKIGGEFKEIIPQELVSPIRDGNDSIIGYDTSCVLFHSRLPDLEPVGQNKALEGNILRTFSYASYPTDLSADSIRFQFQIVDRTGNVSNLVNSPVIPTPQF